MEKKTCAIIVCNNDVLFPNTSQVIEISGDTNIVTIAKSVASRQRAVIAFTKSRNENLNDEDIMTCAALVDIGKVTRVNKVDVRLTVDILELVDIVKLEKSELIFSGEYVTRPEIATVPEETLKSYKKYILSRINTIASLANKQIPVYIREAMDNSSNSTEFVNLASTIVSDMTGKYELLIETDPIVRLDMLSAMMEQACKNLEKMHSIEMRVAERLKKMNNDFFLREQIKEMEKEIGDGDHVSVAEEYRTQLAELKLSEDLSKRLEKEISRLARMNETVPEHSILRNYLDTVLNLPWGKLGEDNKDLVNARAVLEDDHYGIQEVKDRVIEYLAVRMLTDGKNRGGAICLVGPPGVGKTSVARSIAKALNKEYVQLTLGGVHDEAEIRGHRKTYIGAMPGRIISALAKSKTNNPLFLLDEVDKITRDMRGDPQSALLEVLDPNQNTMFRDNYIEIAYDLSKVMFILTANDLSTIDKPLLDRMEVIEMDGYTVEEKIAIATKYLVAKQSAEHGLRGEQLVMSSEVIREIIEGYTNESGVRELERKIAAVCRKVAIEIVTDNIRDSIFVVTIDDLREYLGIRKSADYEMETVSEVGRVCGLAWTTTGGTTLHIEVAITRGSGELKVTGNLGDVMKESATLSMSVAREKAIATGVDPEFFKTHDIHIHVPMGAVPKDGPSAGVTMSTALLSAILNKKIKPSIAMTGEISLSGRVHAIGGLKGKTLAAHRVGVKTIIIPKDNERDIDKLPDSVKNDIKFILAENIEDVLAHAMVGYGD